MSMVMTLAVIGYCSVSCFTSGVIFLEDFHGTAWSISSEHFWIALAVRDKFVFSSASLASSFYNPFKILSSFGAVFTFNFDVSIFHSVMFVTSSPPKEHGVVNLKPYRT